MPRNNRDWKTFNDRWTGSSRLEKFIAWSVTMHVALAMLIWFPVRSTDDLNTKLQEHREQEAVRRKKEMKDAVKRAEDKVNELLQEELAEEQLRQFYDTLTEDYFKAEVSEVYWDELLEELEGDLEDFAELFEDKEEFDPLIVEQSVEDLKTAMLDRLIAIIQRDQTERIVTPILQHVDRISGQLAENLRQALEKQVGQPLGEHLAQVVRRERDALAAQRAKAEADLQVAVDLTRKSEQRLKAAAEEFERHAQSLKNAIDEKDTRAAVEIKGHVRQYKGAADEASGNLLRVRTALRSAAKQLAVASPSTSQELQRADVTHAAAARSEAKQASVAANSGRAADAAEFVRKSAENTKQTRLVAERALVAIRLQKALEVANELGRNTEQQARRTNELANARSSNDQPHATKTTAEIANAEKVVSEIRKRIAKFKSDVEIVNAALKHTGPKRRQGKNDSEEERPLALRTSVIDEAAKELKAAQTSLAKKSPGPSSKRLRSAAQKLGQLASDIARAQERLGVNSESVAEGLYREATKLARTKFPAVAGQQFDQKYRQKTLPQILRQVNAAVDRRIKVEGGLSQSAREKLREKLRDLLGEKTIEKANAATSIKKGADQKLPSQSADSDTNAENENPDRVAQLKSTAEKSAKSLIDRQLSTVAAVAIRKVNLQGLDQAGGTSRKSMTELANRLAELKTKLRTGRKGFFGQTSSTAIARAHRRHQARKRSIGRLGGFATFDPKALEQMVDKMIARGRITGDEFQLKGAAGRASAADDEISLRPALIALPDILDVQTVGDAPIQREVAKPSFETNKFAGIPLLAHDAITFDGNLADWKDVPPLTLDGLRLDRKIRAKTRPTSQVAYLAYCSKGLLVAADIVDASGKTENTIPIGSFWLNDCVEIYIDTLNTKDPRRGERNTHQFFGFPLGHKDCPPEVGGYEASALRQKGKVNWDRAAHPQSIMPRAGRKTEKGWTFEMLIPKQVLRKGDIEPGRILGFNLQIDTGSGLYYFWTCDPKLRPSLYPASWGDVLLLGSDGRIEITDKEGESQSSIVPGEPLFVRVTDPDMDLNKAVKDKISVTARTTGGDTETLILEETKPDSGVFKGSLATTLAIGTVQADRLQIFEGESVSVEYIDQARAYGEHNVPLQTTVMVGSLGVKLAP